MSKKQLTIAPDQAERESALDASRSVLVRAPAANATPTVPTTGAAGSGATGAK